jgi:hypothetical protein
MRPAIASVPARGVRAVTPGQVPPPGAILRIGSMEVTGVRRPQMPGFCVRMTGAATPGVRAAVADVGPPVVACPPAGRATG